ncbi:MAG: Bax inhibitor-1/YccA family protein [Nocardioidaceae bacterium]
MMQSSNPVFARSDAFNGRSANVYGNPTYPGSGPHAGYGQPAPGYTDPSTWRTGDGRGGPSQQTDVDTRRITIDSVVQKTAITLVVLVVAAAATWILTGDLTYEEDAARLNGLAIGGALIGFVLAMVNSFKRVISPALVLAYAVAEGVFIGGISKILETAYNGVVPGAVLGTVAAFAGTLTAYKVLDIKVTDKFRKGVVAAMFGFVAVSMFDLVLSFFGSSFGFNGFGTLGLISSVVGVVLGVLMLILDFDYVERAIAAGVPERESWRAAFGLTVTIVWIYIEMLRILAILRSSD